MVKTYLYIPDELNKEVTALAKAKKSSKAELLRDALTQGVEQIKKRHQGGAEVLLEIARIAKENGVRGPKDASEHMDDYLWKTYEEDYRYR